MSIFINGMQLPKDEVAVIIYSDGDVRTEDWTKYSAIEVPDEIQPAKWIPVTERLPEEIGWYLVKVEAPYKPIRIYKYEPSKWYNDDDNLWRDGDGGDGYYVFNWFVTHWMPLPEPPIC